jgi:hypothetical protein
VGEPGPFGSEHQSVQLLKQNIPLTILRHFQLIFINSDEEPRGLREISRMSDGAAFGGECRACAQNTHTHTRHKQSLIDIQKMFQFKIQHEQAELENLIPLKNNKFS